MRIYKYTLEVTDEQTFDMPIGAKMLSVQVQNGAVVMWVLVNELAEDEPRTVRIFGTGHPIIGKPGDYVGTVQLHNGALAFHVFVLPA